MNLKHLFSYDYQFTVMTLLGNGDKFYPMIGAALIVLAIFSKIAERMSPTPVDKKFRAQFFAPLLFGGIWEVVWFALRWQDIRFFGSHFMAWLGALITLIWLGKIAFAMFKHYSEEKTTWEKEQLKLKYLPK